MDDYEISHLEEQTRLIHKVREDVREIMPLLIDLENLITYRQSLLLARDLLGLYDSESSD